MPHTVADSRSFDELALRFVVISSETLRAGVLRVGNSVGDEQRQREFS